MYETESASSHEILENIESPIEGDPLGIHIQNRTLYHGSANSGTQEFLTHEVAEEQGLTDGATVGNGLYLTSQNKAAQVYAKRRAVHPKNEPTVYEVKIESAKLLDLREQENISLFANTFQTHLFSKMQEGAFNAPQLWYLKNAVIKALQAIEEGVTVQNIQKIAGYAMTKEFTTFIKSLGYDGVVTFEGGEGHESNPDTHVGEHDTYVIFDPTNLVIQNRT